MYIKKILEQNRRDFTAIFECEHCQHTYEDEGYDDENYHQNVVPNMECPPCKKKAPESYRALTLIYSSGAIV